MRRRALLALLLLAAPAGAVDWAESDPAVGWRDALPPAPKATFQPAAAQAPAGPPARFDSYVFSLESMPEFCQTTGADECSGLAPGRWDADHLALHGLWPDRAGDTQHSFAFCGVDGSVRALDHKDTWCRMPDVGLSPATLKDLSAVMPGTVSCLQNHEWYKHGSCSGLSADEYFSRSAALTLRFAQTAPGRFVTGNVGKTVNAEDLLAAFEKEFGAGSRRFAALRCASAGGRELLAEIRLSLAPPLLDADQLGKMLRPSSGGNCPASFTIAAPRAR